MLLSDFNNVDWNINVLNKNITLNEAVLNFTAQLDILCDKHAPLKKVPKRKLIISTSHMDNQTDFAVHNC